MNNKAAQQTREMIWAAKSEENYDTQDSIRLAHSTAANRIANEINQADRHLVDAAEALNSTLMALPSGLGDSIDQIAISINGLPFDDIITTLVATNTKLDKLAAIETKLAGLETRLIAIDGKLNTIGSNLGVLTKIFNGYAEGGWFHKLLSTITRIG